MNGSIISKLQSTFISGRLIFDEILVANEIVGEATMNKKRSNII